jgi:methyl-accepting chemotaxis protein
MTTQPNEKKKIKLGTILRWVFSCVFVTMIVTGIVSQLTTTTLSGAVSWVTHTYKVKENIRELEKHLLEAETGQLGYIFTGEQSFLAPYKRGTQKIKTDWEDLRNILKDNPDQIKRLQQLETLCQSQINEWNQKILIKGSEREKKLQTLILYEQNQKKMEQLRQGFQEMLEEENKLLVIRENNFIFWEQLEKIVSLGGTLITILLGVFIQGFIARRVVQPINNATNAIAVSSTEIAATVKEQERIVSQQALAVNQTTTTMEQLNASSCVTVEQAQAASKGSQQALTLVSGGTKAVANTLEGMAKMKQKVDVIQQQILQLSQQTDQIGNIANLVSELANQTNMLALNAAVEAVRAGEQGKGFSVVASEIRKLADQSRASASKINNLVKDIQNAINSTVMATDEGTKTVAEGTKIAKATAEAFAGVAESINQVVINNQRITLTAQQQVFAIQQVVEAMNSLNLVAKETATGISQVKIGTEDLSQTAQTLKRII